MNAPWNPNRRSAGAAVRATFNAFVSDDTTAAIVRAAASDAGWTDDGINLGGLRNAVETLSVSASPRVLFVDLSDCADPLADINTLAEVCEPGTVVIAAGVANDVRLYRDLLASGIQDYLLKPLREDQLRDTLLAAQAALLGPKTAIPETGHARLALSVIGVRGGSGASSVASSLAWLLGDRAGRATALLDLDIHFGTGALAFDLEPGRGLADALENPGRIDGLFIERAMVRVSDKLAVLSAEAPIAQPLHTDGAAIFHLQEELKTAFESVVIDLPRGVAVANPHLVGEVQTVVVVTEQTLAATRDTIRLLGWLKGQAPAVRVIVAANRVPAAAPEVTRKDFEASIERKLDVAIPLDAKVAVAAARQGKCLAAAAKGSKTGAALDELLALVLGDAGEIAESGPPPSLMSKLSLKGLLSKRQPANG